MIEAGDGREGLDRFRRAGADLVVTDIVMPEAEGLVGTPTHEELCRVAYRFWEERGCPHGSPEVDWARAEQEGRGPAADDADGLHEAAADRASMHTGAR